MNNRMLINYVPGEECRVALVEDGNLEELHSESAQNASRVGNIYQGVVANVESAIQAAFIDFGVEQHGFLHVTDLHPRYFPGEDDETTERVGHKTPRRERPPIQKCLKRGQKIVVQVLKEGVGTKGPSLTSYISIPGRHLVMMPQMDRVGVSRKVEDEQVRRKMREILDQLDLPEGFGFIIRTAGLDKSKTELKRDLAYLMRLWKDMERRREKGKTPSLLYTESDLLVRALRDMVTSDINEIVVDNEHALARAARFMKIVSPRSGAKLLHYRAPAPIFHAYGIEKQIINIHSREVPLPSGGRLVIDQTEALVAIDVNSGKSRSARDAETNAFRTNKEAVDEICRQLKLRDLGGLIIHDLIDMRDGKHRREIEARFRDRLKKDRAKNTILPISSFGILEMTRQRMRSSHETVHFTPCPMCRGRGLVQRAESVAADAMRALGALVDHKPVAKVEIVVGPRIAGELLSNRRKSLARLERLSGKRVDVRVSESFGADRVDYYAYDESGSDVDIANLPEPPKKVDAVPWEGAGRDDWAVDVIDESASIAAEEAKAEQEAEAQLETHPIEFDDGEIDADDDEHAPLKKKRRRRRRRRGAKGSDSDGQEQKADAATESEKSDASPEDKTTDGAEGDDDESESVAPKKKKRRRRRRRKSKGDAPAESQGEEASEKVDGPSASDAADTTDKDGPAPENDADADGDGKKKRKRRRRRKKGSGGAQGADATEETGQAPTEALESGKESASKTEDDARDASTGEEAADKPAKKKRRKRSRKKSEPKDGEAGSQSGDVSSDGKAPAGSPGSAKSETEPKPEVKKPPRTLYASRRRLAPSEKAKLASEE